MRRTGVAAATAVAALSVGLAGCSSPATETPIVVSHVHAVDLDPLSNSAYVATHEGVLSVAADGSVERIGEWAGDVMGMARFGDTIYFSGHPAPDENLPPNIGVYELSMQSGEFAPIALVGEVDFHSMTIAQSPDGMALAGIDSATGQVMVSRDGAETWTSGLPIGARSLSWDANAERLYATTEQGLLVSTDDGMTFTAADGAPLLVLIASSPADVTTEAFLAGVDVDGYVLTSPDGVTWTSTGLAPPLTDAVAVGNDGSIVVAGIEGVHRSDDRGATWTMMAEF
jgi:hypothetical protein